MLLEWARFGPPVQTVVDLACGRGGDVHKTLLTFGPCTRYIGVDISPESILELQRRASEMHAHVETHVGDAATACLPAQQADLVVMNFALHYFTDTEQHLERLIAASVLA